MGFIYLGKESVAIPVPSFKQLDLIAGRLGPWVAVGQGSVNSKSHNAERQEYYSTETAKDWVFTETNARYTSSDIVINLAQSHDREIESWEVVVQEELALHQVEREVMECPSQDHGTDFVIEALEDDVVVVLEASLPA